MAFVELEPDEEFVEGNYFAPQHVQHLLKLKPSDAVCPFCFCRMEVVSCPQLGRIVQQQGEPKGRVVQALVELMPPTHEALKCTDCDVVFTQLRDGTEGT